MSNFYIPKLLIPVKELEISLKPLDTKPHSRQLESSYDHPLEIVQAIKGFINKYGQLFIKTPVGDSYTIYASITAYNIRSYPLGIVNQDQVLIHDHTTVYINPETLKIQWPYGK